MMSALYWDKMPQPCDLIRLQLGDMDHSEQEWILNSVTPVTVNCQTIREVTVCRSHLRYLTHQNPVLKRSSCEIEGCVTKAVRRVTVKLSRKIFILTDQHAQTGSGVCERHRKYFSR